jgi:hypothetical protein
VLIPGTIPVAILTLVGGTVSDRLPRNRVMLASDLVRSATPFVTAAQLPRANTPLWASALTQAALFWEVSLRYTLTRRSSGTAETRRERRYRPEWPISVFAAVSDGAAVTASGGGVPSVFTWPVPSLQRVFGRPFSH